jgi:hypothetical protein
MSLQKEKGLLPQKKNLKPKRESEVHPRHYDFPASALYVSEYST